MARVKGAMMTRKRRNATLKLAKGYWGAKSKHFKMAKQAVMKSGNYAFEGRKQKKRNYRTRWIARISASVAVKWPTPTSVRSCLWTLLKPALRFLPWRKTPSWKVVLWECS